MIEPAGLRRIVAIDCEMVGVRPPPGARKKNGRLRRQQDALARVSVVNALGEVLLDRYCLPIEEIVDYRTEWSGIRMEDLEGASDFETVQAEVLKCLGECTTIIGHSIENDFKVLWISLKEDKVQGRSDNRFQCTFEMSGRCGHGSGERSLRYLANLYLNKNIQSGEHDSVEDAKATMGIYIEMSSVLELPHGSLENLALSESPSESVPIDLDAAMAAYFAQLAIDGDTRFDSDGDY